MLEEIGSKDKVPEMHQAGEGGQEATLWIRTQIPDYHCRTEFIKTIAEEVFKDYSGTLKSHWNWKKTTLSDDYFIKRKLYPT